MARDTPGDQQSPSAFGFPSRRIRSQNGGATPSPAWHRASREVESHLEACVPASARRIGFCRCLAHRLFPCGGLRQMPTVHWWLNQLHSPASPLLLGVPSFQLPPKAFRPEPYLPGSLPSSRHHRRHPVLRRRPADYLFRPQAFSASRRFAPPSAPRAYSIPQPRPGFAVRGLLPPRSHLPSSGRDSPVSFERGLLPARAGSTVNTPRLRGFSPREDAFLGNGV